MALVATFSLKAHSPNTPEMPSGKRIAGTYNIDVDSPYGVIPGVLVVKKVKKSYEVSLTRADETPQTIELNDVEVKGNEIRFFFYYEGMQIGMEMTIDGDKLSGLMMNEYKISGTRAPK